MKVLGITKDGYNAAYIVQVSHSEIVAAFEKCYSNQMPEYKPGDEISLAGIPDQRERIVRATKAMTDAYEQFIKAAPVMAEFARIAAMMPPPIKDGGIST